MSRICLLLLLLISAAGPGASDVAADSAKKLGSVGIQVVPTATGELSVLQVPAGTPAAIAGIRPGDLLVQIDNLRLAGSDFAEVVPRYLWGEEGSRVTLHYLRPGEVGRKNATMRRTAAEPRLIVSPAAGKGAAAGQGAGK